jgi:hypothetical protein
MLIKAQLQQEVQNLEVRLQEFREQLNSYKEVTIETASVGDTLEDGSIVLKKENGLALLVAPKNTEVRATWSKEFTEVFEALKSQGFNPSQWFVPTEKQLRLAYWELSYKFSSTFYWSSDTGVCYAYFSGGNAVYSNKSATRCVRAFRCVNY